MRVALTLARLSKVEITDNWQNKPLNSLKSIFRCWMPQTAASHEARVSVITLLFNRFPSIAWQICMAQFEKDNDTGYYSHKPQWRNDAYGYGEPFKTWAPIRQFQRVMVDIALSREAYDLTMLCDLITRFDILSEDHQKRVQVLIYVWMDRQRGQRYR